MSTGLIGRSLGKTRIESVIGYGGMAAVYLGYQEDLGRQVAIKILEHTPQLNDDLVARFKREARTIAGLQHPHILPLHDYGEDDGLLYLVFPYVRGGSLGDVVKTGALDRTRIEAILRQASAALDYAHRQGVLHRDIKPNNILLDGEGNAVLADFGIARLMEDVTGAEALTHSGGIIGTPAYMSPEQAEGQPLDGRSDLYSLAIVVYELLAGHRPFHAETPVSLLMKQVNEPPPPLPRSPAINLVLQRALAKTPDDRYPTAIAFAAAFSQALQEETQATELIPATHDFLPSQVPVEPPTTKPYAQPAPARLDQRLALIALAVLIVLSIVGLVVTGGTPAAVLAPTATESPTATQEPSQRPAPSATTAPSATAAPSATSAPSETSAASAATAPVAIAADLPQKERIGGYDMVLVPPGCFAMGDQGDGGRQCLDEPYWIDRTEVTNGRYGNHGEWTGDARPRESVTWAEASEFCAARGGRLPTEREWEYAARGPDSRIYPWGDRFDAALVVSSDRRANTEGPAPVGSLPDGASWVGALDMSGNLWEWTRTLYRDYPYAADDGREDPDAEGERVIRGGSYLADDGYLRTSNRAGYDPDIRLGDVGFRCVLPVEEA
ncbi:MAG: SUMF1/EgtB/PvdO family nonheme iron enzyme [Anaerolineae bacterium]|nr:SUMF1/EgtB/PvdO family nonheme iron enzyme [Anaerolineae bacterium]